jgi:sugar/nucleoside kinase (ribokinase family)
MARKYDVAVMHDYFVDRLVHTESLDGALRLVAEKARGGGGGLHGFIQEEVRGGNAVNLAHALARLGLRTLLVTHCGRAHETLLRQSLTGLGAEVRVKPLPAGLTVAFEGEVNVMLGDGRGASDFGPDLLNEADWDALENSRVVCSVNWAANAKGTKLLVALRKRLGKEKTIFMDPADFRDRTPMYTELLSLIAKRGLVDWVSSNEEESRATAVALGVRGGSLSSLCKGLARRLGVVYDLHAAACSCSSEGTRVASARTKLVKPRRLTGAGDVWDAGAIYGRLKGMDEVPRMEFANTAARLYLEGDDVAPPTLRQVLRAVP